MRLSRIFLAVGVGSEGFVLVGMRFLVAFCGTGWGGLERGKNGWGRKRV